MSLRDEIAKIIFATFPSNDRDKHWFCADSILSLFQDETGLELTSEEVTECKSGCHYDMEQDHMYDCIHDEDYDCIECQKQLTAKAQLQKVSPLLASLHAEIASLKARVEAKDKETAKEIFKELEEHSDHDINDDGLIKISHVTGFGETLLEEWYYNFKVKYLKSNQE